MHIIAKDGLKSNGKLWRTIKSVSNESLHTPQIKIIPWNNNNGTKCHKGEFKYYAIESASHHDQLINDTGLVSLGGEVAVPRLTCCKFFFYSLYVKWENLSLKRRKERDVGTSFIAKISRSKYSKYAEFVLNNILLLDNIK